MLHRTPAINQRSAIARGRLRAMIGHSSRPRRASLGPAASLGALAAASVALFAGLAAAQTQVRQDASGQWQPTATTTDSPDRAEMDAIRQLLAQGRGTDAENRVEEWIKRSSKQNAYYPEAVLLRGNAKLLQDREFDALYDYEEVIKDFPGSEQFVPALEKELEVARLYLGGLRRQSWLLLRIDDGVPTAEEIIIRINERLPGSALAEQALLDLANHYYDERDLRMASEAYDVFLTNFPRSEHRELALSRRIYSAIGQFKGPRYNTRSLVDAGVILRQYQDEFPLQAQLAGLDDGLATRLDEGQAAQLLTTSQWYLDRGDPASARLTLRRLIQTHPRTGAAAKAYAYLDSRGWLPKPSEAATTPDPSPDAATSPAAAPAAATEAPPTPQPTPVAAPGPVAPTGSAPR